MIRLILTRAVLALSLFTLIAVVSPAAQAALVYAITPTAVAPGSLLLTFDSATPGTTSAPIAVTGLQAGESLLGIDFRPATGQLFGLGSGSRLYSINPTTGAATQVGSDGAFTLSGTSFGFDFNPTVDRIRVVGNTGQNLRLNPVTGALAATDTALNPGTPSVVGAAYTNNVAGAITTTLYDIDSVADALFIQSPPNAGTLTQVGAGLGFNTSDRVGFDILTTGGVGGTNSAFASLSPVTGGVSQFFTIDLNTGAATLVGTIGIGGNRVGLLIDDIALVPEAAPPGGGGPNAPLPPAMLLGIPGALFALHRARKHRK